MNHAALLDLVRYNNWANRHLLDVAALLPPEQLRAASLFFDHGTAWDTFRHLFDVEWGWLRGIQGHAMTDMLWDVVPLPDLPALRAFALGFGPELEQYVAALTDAELSTPVDINAVGRSPETISRFHILLYIVNHGIAHRTELAHYFTSLGHSPGEVDFLHFILGAVEQQPGPAAGLHP